jgi:exosome complex component RRP4
MISFTSFPARFEDTNFTQTRHHPDVEDDFMELDEHDFDSPGSRLTCPGESLTSSQAYMRWGLPASFVYFSVG